MFARLVASFAFLTVTLAVFATTGCYTAPPARQPTQAKNDDHGWWCAEHGVPEDICSLCNAEHAEKLKKEGDWCKLHDRADSQCFKCDPSKYAKFEAMYVAKYHKKPERPPEEEFKK